ELKNSVIAGERVFVTSNSKRRIERISAALAEAAPERKRIEITSGTVDRGEVKRFIENPAKEALEYRVILTSPSLGTGIDISFEDDASHIDMVFGFFEAMITTHFDIDQQLARVRRPGQVKIWVSSRTARFDTAVDVIKRDNLRHNIYRNMLIDFDG